MEEILQFLENNEIWIYVLLGAVGLIYLRKMLVAWQEWRTTTFGLEREHAQRRFGSALTFVVLLGLMALTELMLVSFISPTYPRANALVTPTVDLLATATATFPVEGGGGLTPVAALTPPAGQLSPAPAAGLDGCLSGEIEWTYPVEGDEISGAVILKGTVNIPNLGFYKYEYSQPGSDTWTTIAAGNTGVVDGDLGQWNTQNLLPGDYILRLVVTDNASTVLTPCGVQVRVVTE